MWRRDPSGRPIYLSPVIRVKPTWPVECFTSVGKLLTWHRREIGMVKPLSISVEISVGSVHEVSPAVDVGEEGICVVGRHTIAVDERVMVVVPSFLVKPSVVVTIVTAMVLENHAFWRRGTSRRIKLFTEHLAGIQNVRMVMVTIIIWVSI